VAVVWAPSTAKTRLQKYSVILPIPVVWVWLDAIKTSRIHFVRESMKALYFALRGVMLDALVPEIFAVRLRRTPAPRLLSLVLAMLEVSLKTERWETIFYVTHAQRGGAIRMMHDACLRS
jgi:hypothetical protein